MYIVQCLSRNIAIVLHARLSIFIMMDSDVTVDLQLFQVGFDALFFSRIDYQDRIKRKNLKSLEVVWRGSRTLRSSADVSCPF